MTKRWYKHIPEGNPVEIDIPEISLQDFFKQSVDTYPNHTAMTFFQKTFTYTELNQLIQIAASNLKNAGIQKGDRVGIMLPNCPQYVISYYAVLLCGAIVVQVNPMYKASELLHVLNDSGSKMLIVLDRLQPLIDQIKDKTALEQVYTVNLEGKDASFNQLLQNRGLPVPSVEMNPKEDVAVLQYTGGTTGLSKGAMLTHYNLVANTLQSEATSKIKTKYGKERTLTISPLFHVYGMTSCMLLNFYIGGNLILVPKFEPELVVNIIEKTKPTIFPGVPTMYIALLDYYKEKRFGLSVLETCVSGSAPLPVEVINKFNNEDPGSEAGYHYVSVYIFVEAMKAAGNVEDAKEIYAHIQDGLDNLPEDKQVYVIEEIDENGGFVMTVRVAAVENGEIIEITAD